MNVLFIGANGSGRSHTMLNLAQLLVNRKSKVLVVDLTESQGLKSYFNIKHELEDGKELIFREGIDIFNFKEKVAIDRFLNFDKSQYDFVLIECDKNINSQILEISDKIFLTQNYDKDKLIKNIDIMRCIDSYSEKVVIVLNQLVDNRIDASYFVDDLIEASTNRFALIQNKQIEIPFSERDILVSIENKVDGRLKIKEYSMDFKIAIEEIATLVS